MPLLAFLLLGSGLLDLYCVLTGRNPIAVLGSAVGNGSAPAANSWLPLTKPEKLSDLGSAIAGAITGNGIGGNVGGTVANAAQRAVLVQAVQSQIGKPYVWDTPANPADPNPASFDCSGLTMWAYHKIGITLPHYTVTQEAAGKTVSVAELQPGDLCFDGPGLDPVHVVMYVGNGQVVSAPHTGATVTQEPLSNVFKLSTVQCRTYLQLNANSANSGSGITGGSGAGGGAGGGGGSSF